MPSTLKHHSPPPPPPAGMVTNNCDSGPGSLRYEIAAANPGETITFAPSLDGQTIALTSGELIINTNLTIQGPGAGLLTVSGNHLSRVFEVDSGTVTLSGMTISNGDGVRSYNSDPAFGGDYYDGVGGGVLNTSGNLTISGCTLSGNFASGGIYIHGGGGAIANFGTLTVSGCTLSNNITHAEGGGIYNAGTLTVSRSTLSGNTAGGTGANYGGGIANEGGTVTVSGCTVSGNSASGGGGIYNAGRTLIVSNSAFSGNTPDNLEGSYTDGGGNTFK